MRISRVLLLLIIAVSSSTIIIFTACKKSDLSGVPAVSTDQANLIGQGWAALNAQVNPDNSTVTLFFDYGTTSSYGNVIEGYPGTLDGTVRTAIKAYPTGLQPGTKYHFRAKAINSTETIYGIDSTFTTTNPSKSVILFNPGLTYGSVTDADNNVYKTILIGTQTWMAENLKTTKYNDGVSIRFLPGLSMWADSSISGYCWFNNDSVVYGAIYNWGAVNSGKLCPTGWHIPSDDEWEALATVVGGDSIAGGILMEAGNGHWLTPNSSLTNETGFTALPGGYRNLSAAYGNIKNYGYWWSATESSAEYADCRLIYYNFKSMTFTNSSKKSGLSVRCIQD
jgi:uncharacterized protein (TIGR02145 family)